MKPYNITILNNGFTPVGAVFPHEYSDSRFVEDLKTGFPTFEVTINKQKCADIFKIQDNSYFMINDEIFSSLFVGNEDEYGKPMSFEHWAVPFLQSDAKAIEASSKPEDLGYYLEETLRGTPIFIGSIEVQSKKILAYRVQRISERLQELYREFDVEPVFTTIFDPSNDTEPMGIQLDLVRHRGREETGIVLDSDTNLITVNYNSSKEDLITAVEVIPLVKEETVKKTIKTAVQTKKVEAKASGSGSSSGSGSGTSKTQKQLEYFTTQVGGNYSQGSVRNQFRRRDGSLIHKATSDCSSMTHKALIYADINIGAPKWKYGQWLWSTREFRSAANAGKHFTVLGRNGDQRVWSKVEPGDLILIRNPAHIATYIGGGGNREIFHSYNNRAKAGYTANWYKRNYEIVFRPKDRGTRKVTKTSKTEKTVIGTASRDQFWVHAKRVGLNDIAAAAAGGNAYQESRYNTQAGRSEKGIFQWGTSRSSGNRWGQLVSFASSRGVSPYSLQTQMDFMRHEMLGSMSSRMVSSAPRYGGKRNAKNGLEAFNSITNVDKATRFFCEQYEIAGTPHMSVRINEAKKLLKDFKGTYAAGEKKSVTVADVKYTTKEVSEQQEVVYSIKDKEHDDGNYYSHAGSNLIVSRKAQQLYGLNKSNNSYHLKSVHEMTSTNIDSEFESALLELMQRCKPADEWHLDIDTADPATKDMVKDLQVGDTVDVVYRNWDKDRDLVLNARVSQRIIQPNDQSPVAITLTDVERIEFQIPERILGIQNQISAANAMDLDNLTVELRPDFTMFLGNGDEAEVRAYVHNSRVDLTHSMPDSAFTWQVFDKNGLPISSVPSHDIVSGDGLANEEGSTIWRTSELVDGNTYTIQPTIIGTTFRFDVFDDEDRKIDESDWLDDTDNIEYVAPPSASYMVVEAKTSPATRPFKVMTEDVPLVYTGKKIFVSADQVDERITLVCRVKGTEGIVSLFKANYTPLRETPPEDYRPGSEWLKPIPDTGVYDENGNWTGQFESFKFDGTNWVSTDIISDNAYNFILDSRRGAESGDYNLISFQLSDPLVPGERYTFVAKATLSPNKTVFALYDSKGERQQSSLQQEGELYLASFTYNPDPTVTNHSFIQLYALPEQQPGISFLDWATLVHGDVGMKQWIPNPADIENQFDGKVDHADFDLVQGQLNELGQIMVTQQQFGEISQALLDYKKMLDDEEIELNQAQKEISNLLSKTNVIEQNLGEVVQNWNFLETSISMSEEGLFIGNKTHKTGVRVANDRVDFVNNETVAAYITNETLYISRGILTDSLTVGEHTQQTLDQGITVWTWTGTETPRLSGG